MSQSDIPLTFDHVFSEQYLRSVYENHISKATFVGLDGISVSSFNNSLDQHVAQISRKVLNRSYRFTRYREKLMFRSAQRPPRQISIPTVRDALALRALCDLLNCQFRECKMKPPHDCTKRVALAAEQAYPSDSFLRLDILNFYPSIHHDTLFKQLNQLSGNGAEDRLVSLIAAAVNNPTGFDEDYDRGVGVPQGLSISNVLAMIYLRTFDNHFEEKYAYFRYVDDIVLIVPSKKAKAIYYEVSGYLKGELKLETHPLSRDQNNKTGITLIDKGVEYLGYHIFRDRLRIRDRSYKKMFRAIVGCLRSRKGGEKVDRIVWQLNLIITGCRIEDRSVGWVFFFRQSTDVRQFHRMDAFVRNQLIYYGLGDHATSIKRFGKAYHEIRYNRAETSYIPNFDNFTLSDMKDAIRLVKGKSAKKLRAMDESEVKEIFWTMVKREVAWLERETIDFVSSSS